MSLAVRLIDLSFG